jgi:ABC-type dipeptide/oligopeptide/nickel transport system permease subunit
MLQEAANVSAVADAPWTLAPAAGIFLLVLGVNLASSSSKGVGSI